MNGPPPGDGPLALICGGGALPFAVADAVAARGRRVILYPIRGFVEPARVSSYPHHWIAVGQFGRFKRLAAQEGCRDVVMIGSLVRPAWSQMRFDLGMLLMLPTILHGFRGGDDHLLSSLGRVMEKAGLRPVGAHEVAPEILVPEGVLGRIAPRAGDTADIDKAFDVLDVNSRFDTGQAVVVADNQVLALEAAEGTDAMLDRVADLRANGRIRLPAGVGVLAKAPKRQQDRRFDLPTIGPMTVEKIVRAGLAGIAVRAGETVIAEPAATAVAADRAGIFVIGIDDHNARACRPEGALS
ncbi:MAG TPA: UDP-2,3-diacylglucosamine diphosphatase LpxI [Pseudolabrys sp.]|nr:UDP-2,3-diacylglucosamine diphosphatase LpxI [Pseudolabrys sp.]